MTNLQAADGAVVQTRGDLHDAAKVVDLSHVIGYLDELGHEHSTLLGLLLRENAGCHPQGDLIEAADTGMQQRGTLCGRKFLLSEGAHQLE
jgi:hypothetical protein